MKVLFLDIEGVLTSKRAQAAALPQQWGALRGMFRFDPVAVGLLQKICEEGEVKIVLSSTWRIGDVVYPYLGKSLKIPVIDKTPELTIGRMARGLEIQCWLEEHPEVTHYAILDDKILDMLEGQEGHVVRTDSTEGISYKNYMELRRILEVKDPLVEFKQTYYKHKYPAFYGIGDFAKGLGYDGIRYY